MLWARALSPADLSAVIEWFSQYVTWMTTHQYGIDEREARNNHGTCWVMQVAAFAKFTGNQSLIEFCKDRYKNILLPNQMAISLTLMTRAFVRWAMASESPR